MTTQTLHTMAREYTVGGVYEGATGWFEVVSIEGMDDRGFAEVTITAAEHPALKLSPMEARQRVLDLLTGWRAVLHIVPERREVACELVSLLNARPLLHDMVPWDVLGLLHEDAKAVQA